MTSSPGKLAQRRGHLVQTVLLVDDNPITTTVDTGALITILDVDQAQRMDIRPESQLDLAVIDFQGRPSTLQVGLSWPVNLRSGANVHQTRLILHSLNETPSPTPSRLPQTAMLLGTDMLGHLGIGVTGLQT
ncbi:hypothetical protein HDU67_004308, partial [Dinochytrium kinnereticum]